MGRTLGDTERRWNASTSSRGRPQRRPAHGIQVKSAELASDPRFQFDADAWMALLAEQRLRIADAAGVDPSKVTIRIGH